MPKLVSIPSVLAGVAASALLLVGSPAAYAVPGACTNTAVLSGPNFGGTFLVDPSGTSVSSGGISYNCIQQQDKLFSNFQFGQLPSVGLATLNFSNVGGLDTHTISLGSGNFVDGNSYTMSYNIEVLPGSPQPHLVSAKSAILQTSGQSSLVQTMLDNDGDNFNNIHFTQNDAVAGPTTSTALDPDVIWLDVTDTLSLSTSPGSNATGISNSFVEAVPEPASLLVLGAGMAGMGLLRRRRKN